MVKKNNDASMVNVLGSLLVALYALGSSLALVHSLILLALSSMFCGLLIGYTTIEEGV